MECRLRQLYRPSFPRARSLHPWQTPAAKCSAKDTQISDATMLSCIRPAAHVLSVWRMQNDSMAFIVMNGNFSKIILIP